MGLLSKIITKNNCSICNAPCAEFLMHSLYDGKICHECLNKAGIKADGTEKTMSVSLLSKRIELFNRLGGDRSKMPPYPYTDISSYERDIIRNQFIYTSKYQKMEDAYYGALPSLDTLWSVLYNTKDFNGKNAQKYEQICLDNIFAFKKIYSTYSVPYDVPLFDCVPAYRRLAMLYEKQGRYEEAVSICMDAINHDVPNEPGDGGSKKIYARLARMAKKAGILDRSDIALMLDNKK